MRQFTLLKGATILNVILGVVMFILLGFIGSIGVFIELDKTDILKPLFDLLGKEASQRITDLMFNIRFGDGTLTDQILLQAGAFSHKIPSFIFEYQVSTMLMVVGFVGLFWIIIINFYGSKCLLRNIKEERMRVGRVNKFKAFFISVLSLPIAPLAGLLMLLGTLFAREPIEKRKLKRNPYYENPYGPMV